MRRGGESYSRRALQKLPRTGNKDHLRNHILTPAILPPTVAGLVAVTAHDHPTRHMNAFHETLVPLLLLGAPFPPPKHRRKLQKTGATVALHH